MASAGKWRTCADYYLACVQAAPRAWEWRWYAFSGFTSLVAGEKRFAPSEADLKFLQRIADDADELCHFRAEAEFSLGLARWEAHDRDGAARHYRLALKRVSAATTAERRAREKASATMGMIRAGHPPICNKAVGAILDCIVSDARDNLGVLENPQSAAAMAFMQLSPRQRCDGSFIPREYRKAGPPVASKAAVTESSASPFQIFYRDLSGKHGTLNGVRHDDLSSTVLRRIAAKLGLSEAVTSTLRLIKAGKVLDLSAASLLAKGDTVHVLSRLDGGIRIREVESASGAALTDAPCATSSDGDAEDASDVANVPDPACDDREDDDDDSDDYESDGHAPGLSAMFHGMAELTNGRVCIAGSYALHHYLRVHRGVDGWPCWTPGDIDIFYCPHGGELDGDELRRCLVHMARCCQVQMCGAGEVGTFQQQTSACYPAQVKGDSIEDSEDEASVAAFAREQLLSLCVRERPRAREYALQCRARTARLRVGSVAHARLCAPTGTGSARAPSSSTPPHVTASHCVPSSTSWRWSPWGTLRRLAPTLTSPLAFLLDSTSCRARSRTSAARARS